MPTGTVKWFNVTKGFGFIAPDDNSEDLFVHFSAIVSNNYQPLKENQRVSFDVADGQKGKLASNVKSI